MQVAEGGPPELPEPDDELLLELDEELDDVLPLLELDEELDDVLPLLELDDELEDDLPLLELEDDELAEDELLLELEEEELEEDELNDVLPLLELDDELDEEELLELPPPCTVNDVIVGRPVPVPQKPNVDVPPLAAIAWL